MTQPSSQLKRQLGVPGATLMGLGSIIGTGIFVSIGIAADIAGPAVLLTIIAAALVATCNALSSAQLAAAHPVSGGTYEYGCRYLHPAAGFSAGWLFLSAKAASAATAALGLAGYALDLAHLPASWNTPLALVTVALVTLLVTRGVRQSNLANIIIVCITLLGLLAFVIVGVPVAMKQQPSHLWPWWPASQASSFTHHLPSLLEACALMFVAYTGYGRIATLGEEVRQPRQTIPRAIVLTLLISASLYVAVAAVAIGVAGAPALAKATRDTAAPLEHVASLIDQPGLRPLVALCAMTAMLGVLLNLVLGLSRVVLAMGRRGDMPASLARVTPHTASPQAAVVAVGALIALLACAGSIRLAWSFSALTVLVYYAITNLAALKLPSQDRMYHKAFAWAGLLACVFLAYWVDAVAWCLGSAWLAAGLLWHCIRQAACAKA